jgi:hypothetical protein
MLQQRIESLEAQVAGLTAIETRLSGLDAKSESVARDVSAVDQKADGRAREILDSLGAVEEHIRKLWDRAAVVDGQFKDVWRNAAATDERFKDVWGNAALTDKQIGNIWENTKLVDEELRKLWDKAAENDIRFKDIWRHAAFADEQFKNVWNKVEIYDGNFKSVWNKLVAVDAEFLNLWQRLDFVRREMLFEMSSTLSARKSESVTPKILAPDKVGAARKDGPRLNLGCGHIQFENFINVDGRELPGVDVKAEVGNLPFEPGSVDEIFSAHLLEHFTQEDLKRRLLPYWISLLRPDGVFRAIVPDGQAMLENLSKGDYSYDEFRTALFGGQDYEGDFHFNLFTPKSLSLLLSESGLVNITTPVTQRRNGDCYEFEIIGHRSTQSS